MSSIDSGIHWLRPFEGREQISLVVFDFDGTLSWLRHGWPEIMRGLFREHLPPRDDETPQALDALLDEEILRLNGKPTIFQMRRFAEICCERGRASLEPEALRIEYQRRLDRAITDRSEEIRSGCASQEDYLLFGARPLLEHLIRRGLKPMILSSTVVERVREEAELLGIAPLFGQHIYGGVGDPLTFSKRAVFQRLLQEERIEGRSLVSFGDGPVEIADTRWLGGLAVGVCSDEQVNGSGVLHPQKRLQLGEAGADCLIPDFRDAIHLIDGLLDGPCG